MTEEFRLTGGEIGVSIAHPSDLDVDPLLIAAVIHVESRGNPLAQSACYAMGLMQIRPSTAVLYGGEPGRLFDPAYNVELGTKILAELIAEHGLEAALSVWNTGRPDHPRGTHYAALVLDEYRERTGAR